MAWPPKKITSLPTLPGSLVRDLPKLKTIAHIPRYYPQTNLPVMPVDRPVSTELHSLPQIPGYGSSWEAWLDGALKKINPFWQYQFSFTGKAAGGTVADWGNVVIKAVIYLNGFWTHRSSWGESHDQVAQSIWLTLGYRVVNWDVLDPNDMIRDFTNWYHSNFG